MPKQIKWILMLVLVFALASLACQTLTGGDEEAAPESNGDAEQPAATSAPAENSQPEDGPAESQPSPLLDLGQLSGLAQPADVNSYRLQLTMRVEPEGGGDALGTITMEGAFQVEPPASTLAITMEGLDDLGAEVGSMSFTQIEGTTYMVLGGSCIASEDTQDTSAFTDLADLDNFLADAGQAELVESNVTVNGVQTDHYAFEEQTVAAVNGLTEVRGDIFIATDGGFPVRILFTGTGNLGSLGVGDSEQGTIVYEMNFLDIDQPVTIEPPPGCAAAGDSEFPLLDDAFEITNLGDFLTYKTNKPFAEVVEFYRTEMAAAGWTLSNEFASDPVAQLGFSKDGREVTVSVVEDSTSDALLVNIIQ